MSFRWNEWNTEHIALHGVEPEEAEEAVLGAALPYPRYRGDGKWLVWGRGSGDRLLQVVFVCDPDDSVFVIHARPLTAAERRRFSRSQR